MATPNQPNQPNQPTPATAAELEKLRKYFEQSNLSAGEIVKKLSALKDGGADFNRELENANEHFRKINSKLDSIRESWQEVLDDLKNANTASGQIDKSMKSMSSMAEKLSYHQRDISRLSLTQLENMKKQAQQELDNLRVQRNILETKRHTIGLNEEEMKRLVEIADQMDENGDLIDGENQRIQKTLALLDEQLAREKKINEAMGLTGALVKGITSSLEKLGIRSEFFENIKEDMREAAESGNKWKVLGVGIQGVFKGIGNAMRDPLVLIGLAYKAVKGLYDLVVQYESKLFEMSKSLGVSLAHTGELFEKFKGIAISNNQLAITSKQIAEHYAQINSSLGFMGPIGEEFLTTSLGIQRRTGATAEDMQNMALFSKSTGKTLEQTYATVIGTAKATAVQNNFMMSEKQIMEGISKSSATVFNNFKGNVAQLGAAVVQATKLGTTLDQMNQAGMQMLDFESSISKQFEAQLLTGKNLDLSRARQYALTGKTQDLMKEITTQLGSQESWSKMNVLQQQSLAEALGMSKEAVDEMFKKQRLVNELGDLANSSTRTQYETLVKQGKSHDDIAKLLGNEAAESAKQASVQEQMAVVMENLKDSFSELSKAFLPIVRGFANIVGNAENLKKLIYGAAAGALVLLGYSIYITRQKEMQALSTAKNIAAQTRLAQLQLELTAAANQEALAKNAALKSSIQEAVADKAALPTDISRTEASIVRAGAESAAGSGYLGPLALGVGALVIAGLSAYLMSAGLGGGGGGGAAVPLPSSSPNSEMNPANAATMGGGGASNRPMIQSVANERPINVTFQAQVVDTGANMSSRADKGVYFDRTNMNRGYN